MKAKMKTMKIDDQQLNKISQAETTVSEFNAFLIQRGMRHWSKVVLLSVVVGLVVFGVLSANGENPMWFKICIPGLVAFTVGLFTHKEADRNSNPVPAHIIAAMSADAQMSISKLMNATKDKVVRVQHLEAYVRDIASETARQAYQEEQLAMVRAANSSQIEALDKVARAGISVQSQSKE